MSNCWTCKYHSASHDGFCYDYCECTNKKANEEDYHDDKENNCPYYENEVI